MKWTSRGHPRMSGCEGRGPCLRRLQDWEARERERRKRIPGGWTSPRGISIASFSFLYFFGKDAFRLSACHIPLHSAHGLTGEQGFKGGGRRKGVSVYPSLFVFLPCVSGFSTDGMVLSVFSLHDEEMTTFLLMLCWPAQGSGHNHTRNPAVSVGRGLERRPANAPWP